MWVKSNHPGFTIVELLIVIVVIGILAAITILSYNGIQGRAQVAAVSAALVQSNQKLALYLVDSAAYPPDLKTAGISNSPSGTSYQYSVNNAASPQTYCVTATDGTTSYFASSTTNTPAKGGCPGHGVGGVGAVTNLIPNPSFEGTLINWGWANRAGYTGALSSTQAFAGVSSFAITAPATVADSYFETYVNVTPGTYAISGYVYLTGNGTTIIGRDVMFNFGTGAGTSLGIDPTYDRSKLNQWQRIQRAVTATANSSVRIRFYGTTDAVTYIDGVMVTQGSIAPAYGDGASPDWIWNGPTNNSTSTGPAL